MITFFATIWASLWTDNTTPGRLIISLIVILSLRACFMGWRHLGRYRNEHRQLDSVTRRLLLNQPVASDSDQPPAETASSPQVDQDGKDSVPARQDDDQGRQAASDETTEAWSSDDGGSKTDPLDRWKSLSRAGAVATVDLTELRTGIDDDSLIGQRLNAMEKMRGHQVKINLRTLQRLTLAKEGSHKGLEALSFTANIAMMLGVLGTFLGLSMMVQEIQFSLPSDADGVTLESWTSAFRNISTVLAGIKIAFSTSLVGMTFATGLTLFASRLEQRQKTFLEQLERFTTEDLLPASVPTSEDESLLERVSIQLENSFLHLDEVSQQNRTVLQDLTGAQAAFADIVEEIRLITKNEASRNLDQVIEQLGQTNQSVLSVVDKLPAIAHAVETGQRRLVDRLSPWQQTTAGLGALWNGRLFGCLPGALVMLTLLAMFLLGVLRFISEWR